MNRNLKENCFSASSRRQSRAWNGLTWMLLFGRHRSCSSSLKSTSALSIFSCLKRMNGIQKFARYKNILEIYLVYENVF